MKLITLTQGQFAKVDDEDFDEQNLFTWQARWNPQTKSYYALRTDYSQGGKKSILMHREIMKTPKGMICDHRNHDTLFNCKENLRNVTNSQNAMNRNKASNNTSGYKGVSKHKNKWDAQIKKDGRLMFLKSCATAEEAARVYDDKAKELFGEFALLNFG